MGSGSWQWKLGGAVFVGALVLAGAARADNSGDGYQSGQGTKLYGIDPVFGENLPVSFDKAQYLYRSGLRVTPALLSFTATLEHGQLKGQVDLGRGQGKKNLEGADFNNVSFTATGPDQEPVTLTLSRAQRHRNIYHLRSESSERWDYQVRWSTSKASGNLCPKGTSALVVPYTGGLGALRSSTGMFSFACLPHFMLFHEGYRGGGVAAKCSDWGYAPWWVRGESAFAGEEPAGPLSPEEQQERDGKALRYHVACTAMATADYCGEGAPHTLNSTPIVMFDTHDVKTAPVQPPSTQPHVTLGPVGSSGNFFFEAAWKVDISPASGLMTAQALCLTKKRWSTFPVSGVCAKRFGNLLDPRSINDDTLTQSYCDDPRDDASSLQKLLDKGALLFSYSMFADAGLYRFKKSTPGSPDEFLTTADVSILPNRTYPMSYQPGFAVGQDYVLDDGSYDQPLNPFEGTLITEDGRQTQVFSPVKSNLRPLWRYAQTTSAGGNGYLTASAGEAQPNGVLEGYVYQPDESLTPAQKTQVGTWPMLKLWRNGQSQVTSINGPGLQGYQSTDQGYVPSLVDYSQYLPQ